MSVYVGAFVLVVTVVMEQRRFAELRVVWCEEWARLRRGGRAGKANFRSARVVHGKVNVHRH